MKLFLRFEDIDGWPILIDPLMVFSIEGSIDRDGKREEHTVDIVSAGGYRQTVKGTCADVRDKMYAEINKGLTMTSPWNICPQVSADEKKAP